MAKLFDRVIAYESIKGELLQVCDMIKNREVYKAVGARLPRGVLLYGVPGLGKTLMAEAFIEESGLKAYTVRRSEGSSDFIAFIANVFKMAKKNEPCIVFLDDMDKFANEDFRHRDAEEYVAVQAGIDEIKDSEVFIIATANDIKKLPDSLIRPGRFDRVLEVKVPTERDAEEIIKYYLSGKKVSEDVNFEDISKMIGYHSCAELEALLNEAAISAAYERREYMEMKDLVKAVLRLQYDSPDVYSETDREELRRIAYHEAGHLVVSEALLPGSVGMASICVRGRSDNRGFVRSCRRPKSRSDEMRTALGGKAAVELYFSDECADGCGADLRRAIACLGSSISDAMYGMALRDMDVVDNYVSESLKERSEAAAAAEMERYLSEARGILVTNRAFLEKTAEALLEKGTLLYSDIRKLRESYAAASAAA